MLARTSQRIPGWVARSIELACTSVPVRQSQVLESPYDGGRWDVVIELENGSEVLAWIDPFEQTPAGVEGMIKQALEDAGVLA